MYLRQMVGQCVLAAYSARFRPHRSSKRAGTMQDLEPGGIPCTNHLKANLM